MEWTNPYILRVDGRGYAVPRDIPLRSGVQQVQAYDLTGKVADDVTEVGLEALPDGKARLWSVIVDDVIDDPPSDMRFAVVDPVVLDVEIRINAERG